ncbi:MAG: ROK family protein [Hyphomicrobium sp.]|nr:ROK family protein [Hyphomicrobium sp.]
MNPSEAPRPVRLGIDLGGTKIEGLALASDGREIVRRRVAAPRNDYRGTIEAIVGLLADIEQCAGLPSGETSIGVGMPGSISPTSGNVQNANSTWLNGRPLQRDLSERLGRAVRMANDANCFALSEATDGAAAGAEVVLGLILGTGCGSGIVVNGRVFDGPRGIGGEWGHNPLPAPKDDERPGPLCWCGRPGCLETWVSGPGLEADYAHHSGRTVGAEAIAAAAASGDEGARRALDRHLDRLARGLATLVNVLDPDVIVIGGGLSKLGHLYHVLPARLAPLVFADDPRVVIRPPKWGDASGVRGAARLWP